MPWVKLVLNLWKVLGHHCPESYIQCDIFGIEACISMERTNLEVQREWF